MPVTEKIYPKILEYQKSLENFVALKGGDCERRAEAAYRLLVTRGRARLFLDLEILPELRRAWEILEEAFSLLAGEIPPLIFPWLYPGWLIPRAKDFVEAFYLATSEEEKAELLWEEARDLGLDVLLEREYLELVQGQMEEMPLEEEGLKRLNELKAFLGKLDEFLWENRECLEALRPVVEGRARDLAGYADRGRFWWWFYFDNLHLVQLLLGLTRWQRARAQWHPSLLSAPETTMSVEAEGKTVLFKVEVPPQLSQGTLLFGLSVPKNMRRKYEGYRAELWMAIEGEEEEKLLETRVEKGGIAFRATLKDFQEQEEGSLPLEGLRLRLVRPDLEGKGPRDVPGLQDDGRKDVL